jgi:hypothetical protein
VVVVFTQKQQKKMSSNSKKQGTRVFKKGSPNGKITVYLGKRDFVDHVTHVDPIDGVVLVDPEYLKVSFVDKKGIRVISIDGVLVLADPEYLKVIGLCGS